MTGICGKCGKDLGNITYYSPIGYCDDCNPKIYKFLFGFFEARNRGEYNTRYDKFIQYISYKLGVVYFELLTKLKGAKKK